MGNDSSDSSEACSYLVPYKQLSIVADTIRGTLTKRHKLALWDLCTVKANWAFVFRQHYSSFWNDEMPFKIFLTLKQMLLKTGVVRLTGVTVPSLGAQIWEKHCEEMMILILCGGHCAFLLNLSELWYNTKGHVGHGRLWEPKLHLLSCFGYRHSFYSPSS